jgi:hypothetical protein
MWPKQSTRPPSPCAPQPRGSERPCRPAHQRTAISASRRRLRAVDQGQPNNLDGWRGLFLAYARGNQNQKALAHRRALPAGRQGSLLSATPSTCARWHHLSGPGPQCRCAARARAGAGAAVPRQRAPASRQDTKLQYAGILMEAKRYDQAIASVHAGASTKIAAMSPHGWAWSARITNWARTRRPSPMWRRCRRHLRVALGDPGFLSMLGAIYQQANQFEVAQGLLERSAKLQIAAGGQPSVCSPIAVGRHLPAPQQHRAGLRHLPPGAQSESRPRRCLEGPDLHPAATNRNNEAFRDRADSARRCASSLKTTSNSCRAKPASTPPAAIRPMPSNT